MSAYVRARPAPGVARHPHDGRPRRRRHGRRDLRRSGTAGATWWRRRPSWRGSASPTRSAELRPARRSVSPVPPDHLVAPTAGCRRERRPVRAVRPRCPGRPLRPFHGGPAVARGARRAPCARTINRPPSSETSTRGVVAVVECDDGPHIRLMAVDPSARRPRSRPCAPAGGRGLGA